MIMTPEPNEWVIATHRWVKYNGIPVTMKCKFVTFSDDSHEGFFDGMKTRIWNIDEVASWEPLATGDK